MLQSYIESATALSERSNRRLSFTSAANSVVNGIKISHELRSPVLPKIL